MNKAILTLSLWLLFFVVSGFGQEARKIDEFGNLACDDYLQRIHSIVYELEENPKSKIFVLVYEGKRDECNIRTKRCRGQRPRFGLAKAIIKSIKRRLEFVQAKHTDVIFIEAGFREHLSVELWSVSPDGTPPKPTPTIKKMKYRKGKPEGFCIACCD